MATAKAARHDKPIILHENEDLIEVRTPEHDRSSKVKQGQVRLDRRSAQGVSGNPKKSGKGGSYTWNGSFDETSLDDAPTALDKNDPNYVDEDELEEVDVAKPDDNKAKQNEIAHPSSLTEFVGPK